MKAVKSAKPRAAFFGTSEFAVPSLRALHDLAEIVAVVTAPDQPAGRGLAVLESPVAAAARSLSLPILTPAKVREALPPLQSAQLDLIVLAAYGKLLPEEVLALPAHGALNLHPSLLPKYRGPSPIQAALLNADEQTGVTLMEMSKEMDAGPVVAAVKVPMERGDDYPRLSERLAGAAAKLLQNNLVSYLAGELTPTAQDESLASYCQLLKRADGRIDWHRSAIEIAWQIKALTPWPGTFTTLDGATVKILTAHAVTDLDLGTQAPGQSIGGKLLRIACGMFALEVELLQLPGKKPINGEQFLLGHRGVPLRFV